MEFFGEDKASTPLHRIIHPSPSLHITLQFGIIFTHLLFAKGEKVKGLSNVSIFGDSCQRGRNIKPKAKEPHHHQFSKVFKEVFIWYKMLIYFKIGITKTLLNTERRISLRGSFV
jgi:hypothetical protein